MSAAPFDSLEMAQSLEMAGFTDSQATGLAKALATMLSSADLPTRSDLAAQGSALRSEMADLRTELRSDMAGLRTELQSDMAGLQTRLQSEITDLRTEVKRDTTSLDQRLTLLHAETRSTIEILRRDLTIKLGSMIFVAVGVILAAMRMMPHP
jgi:uncharacterized protein involved in exopolysaccharide biosynthesis